MQRRRQLLQELSYLLRVVAKADSRLLVRHLHLTAATAARVTALFKLPGCGDGQLSATSVIQAAPNLPFSESHIPTVFRPRQTIVGQAPIVWWVKRKLF